MTSWEIIGKATQFTAEEMGIALKRSAISPNIRERMDHSCAILGSEGGIVAQAEHIPVHLGSFREGARNILSWIRGSKMVLREGDMLITNDPYISGTHANDVAILAPVEIDGVTAAYVINKAHNVDVGGPSFGSLNPSATNMYQEGLIIPPVRILRNGAVDQEIMSFLLNNFKDPETAVGDINAQIAANLTGQARIHELFLRFGSDEVISSWKRLVESTRKIALFSISNWRKGSFSAKDYLEVGNEKVPIHVTLTIDDTGIAADFSGTSMQVEYPINAVRGVTFSAVSYAVRSAMQADFPTNDGFYSILDVTAPSGSLVNPIKPHPVAAGNVETTQRIADVVLHALSKSLNNMIPSASSGTMFNVMMGGARENGGYWAYYETIGGGNGASPIRKGVSGIHSNMTNTLNTPIEIAEREYPFLYKEYRIRKNSGGAGKLRGGDGIVRSFVVTRRCNLSVIADRFIVRPYALSGGEEGKPGRLFIVHRGKKRSYPSKFSKELDPGDEVIILTPGGSGYGRASR